jgi:hypothetical protein
LDSSSAPHTPITIRIYLADGIPEGLRLVEKSLWTGIAVQCSRSQYPKVRNRDEFSRPGVYVLVGADPDTPGGIIVYIGQAEVARARLDQHLKGDKDSWERLVLFTNKDANFNNAHFRYLEARLINLAMSAKRARVENGNVPVAPRLSEPDQADADSFLRDMLLIYPVMGIDAFSQVPSAKVMPPPPKEEAPLLYLKGKEASARGRETPEGFIVYKGSIATSSEAPAFKDKSYKQLRDQLITKGVIASNGANLLFTEDYLFNAPSAAASVIRGTQLNGLLHWQDEHGTPLKELQARALTTVAGTATDAGVGTSDG